MLFHVMIDFPDDNCQWLLVLRTRILLFAATFAIETMERGRKPQHLLMGQRFYL